MKRILGLDISSTTIGEAILEDKKLIYVDFFKPPKEIKTSLLLSLADTKEHIIQLLEKYDPDEVIIEDIAKHIPNKSSANTIIKLAVYNRTVALTCYEHLGFEPKFMNVNTVRSIIKPKDHRGRLSKEDVPETVSKILDYEFEYIYKRTGKLSDENYDMADAVAVALAWQLKSD